MLLLWQQAPPKQGQQLIPGGLGGMVPAPPTHQMQGLSLHSGAGGQQQWYNQQQMYGNQSKCKITNFIAFTKVNVYLSMYCPTCWESMYIRTLKCTPNMYGILIRGTYIVYVHELETE